MGPERRLPAPPQECLAEPLETVPLVRLKADPLEGFFPHLPSLVPPEHPLPHPCLPPPAWLWGRVTQAASSSSEGV